MRIYTDPLQAVIEVERDLWEMGINVQVQTMQDKQVANDPDYLTKEVRGYAFQIVDYAWNQEREVDVVNHVYDKPQDGVPVLKYIEQEFQDRIGGVAMNPGKAWALRPEVWEQFLHNGKFAYTYSERITPQLLRVIEELQVRPETRQAIIEIHSRLRVYQQRNQQEVHPGADLTNMGGHGRIPCSMYYQFMKREGKLDMVYTMRSCDFLTHFVIDIMLATRLQRYVAKQLGVPVGLFTYFTGSLHAYAKDMKDRGIF